MKKLFLMLVAIVCFGVYASAQTCPIPGESHSISIVEKKKITKDIIREVCFKTTAEAGYQLTIDNPSRDKNVSFKITAIRTNNMEDEVQFGTVSKTSGSRGRAFVCFKASNKDDFHIADFKLEITSCE